MTPDQLTASMIINYGFSWKYFDVDENGKSLVEYNQKLFCCEFDCKDGNRRFLKMRIAVSAINDESFMVNFLKFIEKQILKYK